MANRRNTSINPNKLKDLIKKTLKEQSFEDNFLPSGTLGDPTGPTSGAFDPTSFMNTMFGHLFSHPNPCQFFSKRYMILYNKLSTFGSNNPLWQNTLACKLYILYQIMLNVPCGFSLGERINESTGELLKEMMGLPRIPDYVMEVITPQQKSYMDNGVMKAMREFDSMGRRDPDRDPVTSNPNIPVSDTDIPPSLMDRPVMDRPLQEQMGGGIFAGNAAGYNASPFAYMLWTGNMSYKLMQTPDGTPVPTVLRKSDGIAIPFDEGNRDYRKYLEWVAEGNTAEAAD